MNWFDWVILSWMAVNGLGAVAMIGKHREPITPGEAVIMVVIYALMIWGVLANS